MKQILIILITVITSLNFICNAKNNTRNNSAQEKADRAAYFLANKVANEIDGAIVLTEDYLHLGYFIDLSKCYEFQRDIKCIDSIFSLICLEDNSIEKLSAWRQTDDPGIIGTGFIVDKNLVIVLLICKESYYLLNFQGSYE